MATKLVGQDGSPVKYQGKEIFSVEYSGVVKSVDMVKRTLVMVGTDETKDRDGDIIRLSGWNLDNYKKNPVFLWAHNYGSVPLARAEKVTKKKEPPRMEFQLVFPTKGIYPFADMILELYMEKIINASSVGFIPTKWNPIEDDNKDGNNRVQYGREYISQELLELSGCPVPSNPSAVQNALKGKNFGFRDDDLLKYLTGATLIPRPDKEDDIVEEMVKSETEIVDETSIQVQVVEDLVKGSVENVPPVTAESVPEVVATLVEVVDGNSPSEGVKGSMMDQCGSGDLPTNPDSSWDGKAAVKRMRELCGGPDKDKMDWSKYGKGFVMKDSGDKESFGSYHLPFADVKDGKLTAVWGGVMRAMNAVHGGRGGVNMSDEDKKKAHNFLAKYYKKFDKPVPEMDSIFDLEKFGVDFPEELDIIKSEEISLKDEQMMEMMKKMMEMMMGMKGSMGKMEDMPDMMKKMGKTMEDMMKMMETMMEDSKSFVDASKGIQDSLAKALEEFQRMPKGRENSSSLILREAFDQGKKKEPKPKEKFSKESLDGLKTAVLELNNALKGLNLTN